MDENNMTAAGQTAPAAAQTEAPAEAAGQTVTIGALRGAIERRQEQNMRRAAEQTAARWSHEADELTAQCPDFDLGAALNDARFCALLRAGGAEISATPRGYVLKQEQNLQTRTIACRHDDEHLLQELYIAVDNGCAVLDVTVEHPIYGQISGQLQVFSRYDADQFYHKLTTTNAPPLCALTGGVHLHTIQFQHEEDFERVVSRLREEGILFSE